MAGKSNIIAKELKLTKHHCPNYNAHCISSCISCIVSGKTGIRT